MIPRHKILQPDEIAVVLEHMASKQHTKNGQLDLVIFRLACCYGLRRGEIVGLNLGDVVVDGPCPLINIRKATTKGKASYGRARTIPLDIDQGSLADIKRWHELRSQVAGGSDPFVCGMSTGPKQHTFGKRLTEGLVARRWKTALKILAEARRKQLSIHKGRHTFCSHVMAAGYSLVEVKEMAGHRNIATTDIYAHSLDREQRPDAFPYASSQQSQPRPSRQKRA